MPTTSPARLGRTDVLAGIGFIVFFLGGVASSSPPKDTASDATWIANYTGTSNDVGHVMSGVFLVLAGLSLMCFLAGMWRYINAARPGGAAEASPVPLVAAGIAATCMAVGGTLMAYIAGSELSNKYPLPSVDLLRLSNGLGFILTGIPGMAATALCIAVLARQGHISGAFGNKLAVFSWIVALVLLLSFLFVPIVALVIWIVVCLVRCGRASRAVVAPAHVAERQVA